MGLTHSSAPPFPTNKFVRAFGGLFFVVTEDAWNKYKHKCEPLGNVPHTYKIQLNDGTAIVTYITHNDLVAISEGYSVGRFIRDEEKELIRMSDDSKIFQVIHFQLDSKSPPTLSHVISTSTQEGSQELDKDSSSSEEEEDEASPGVTSKLLGWMKSYVWNDESPSCEGDSPEPDEISPDTISPERGLSISPERGMSISPVPVDEKVSPSMSGTSPSCEGSPFPPRLVSAQRRCRKKNPSVTVSDASAELEQRGSPVRRLRSSASRKRKSVCTPVPIDPKRPAAWERFET